MTIKLYKKTHRTTGLKYLGKTIEHDAHKYQGSGTDWIPHIEEYGYDVDTEILLETDDSTEIKKLGRYYSELWDVVNSKEWANRKPETGNGGWEYVNANGLAGHENNRDRSPFANRDRYDDNWWKKVDENRQIAVAKAFQEGRMVSPFKNQKIQAEMLERSQSPQSRKKRIESFERIKHQQGSSNSQYGTCWITNGKENKKIKKSELDKYLLKGYSKGRV